MLVIYHKFMLGHLGYAAPRTLKTQISSIQTQGFPLITDWDTLEVELINFAGCKPE